MSKLCGGLKGLNELNKTVSNRRWIRSEKVRKGEAMQELRITIRYRLTREVRDAAFFVHYSEKPASVIDMHKMNQ